MFRPVINTFEDPWDKIVAKWRKMNEAYISSFNDLPAWYVENANTALFSAAAWACGYESLCEPRVDKSALTGQRGRPKIYSGRLDMEVFVGGRWVWLEAKKAHFNFTHKTDGRSERRQRLVNLIDGAQDSARRCRKEAIEFGAKLAAISFFSASVAPDSNERCDDSALRGGLGKTTAVERAIKSEIDAMTGRLASYAEERKADLQVAIFRNTGTRLQSWADKDYPAAFGVIMSWIGV